MILSFSKLEDGKFCYEDTHRVLGIYEVFGSNYIITTAKPNSGSLVEVMEFVSRAYMKLSDDKINEVLGDEFIMGVRPVKTPIARYIERVYLNRRDDFFVDGMEFELPKELIDTSNDNTSDKTIPYIPSAPRSSGNLHFKSCCEDMFDGFAYALVLDDELFELGRFEKFRCTKHNSEMKDILSRHSGKFRTKKK